jgi:hypothetical protein
MRYLHAGMGFALLTVLLGLGCPFKIQVNATNSNAFDVTVTTLGDGVEADETIVPAGTNQKLYRVEFDELPSELRFIVDGVLLSGDTDKTFLDPLPNETFTITVLGNGNVEITRSSGLTTAASLLSEIVSPALDDSETSGASSEPPPAPGRARARR